MQCAWVWNLCVLRLHSLAYYMAAHIKCLHVLTLSGCTSRQVLICPHHCSLLSTCVIHAILSPYAYTSYVRYCPEDGCLATACISLLPGGYFTNSYADSIRHSHNGFPRLILGSSLDELLKERDPVPYSK